VPTLVRSMLTRSGLRSVRNKQLGSASGTKPILGIDFYYDTWAQSRTGSVTFSSSIANLVKGSCPVMMTAITSGAVTINAACGGDLGTRNLTMK